MWHKKWRFPRFCRTCSSAAWGDVSTVSPPPPAPRYAILNDVSSQGFKSPLSVTLWTRYYATVVDFPYSQSFPPVGPTHLNSPGGSTDHQSSKTGGSISVEQAAARRTDNVGYIDITPESRWYSVTCMTWYTTVTYNTKQYYGSDHFNAFLFETTRWKPDARNKMSDSTREMSWLYRFSADWRIVMFDRRRYGWLILSDIRTVWVSAATMRSSFIRRCTVESVGPFFHVEFVTSWYCIIWFSLVCNV